MAKIIRREWTNDGPNGRWSGMSPPVIPSPSMAGGNGEPRGVPLNKQALAALVSVEPDSDKTEGARPDRPLKEFQEVLTHI